MWERFSIKPLAQKKLKRQLGCAKKNAEPSIPPGKVGHFLLSSVSGSCILIDFLFLGYFYQSIKQLDITICSIKCHQLIDNSIQHNHFNIKCHQLIENSIQHNHFNIQSGNVSMLQIHCNMIYPASQSIFNGFFVQFC